MSYAKFKIEAFKQKFGRTDTMFNVEPNLTGLTFNGKGTVNKGEAYRCYIYPEAGKYLPQVIEVTGTLSTYAFKYDYTTGEIYIPSGEIIDDVIITATASDLDTNVPVTLNVQKITADTYDSTTTHTGQSFVILNIIRL